MKVSIRNGIIRKDKFNRLYMWGKTLENETEVLIYSNNFEDLRSGQVIEISNYKEIEKNNSKLIVAIYEKKPETVTTRQKGIQVFAGIHGFIEIYNVKNIDEYFCSAEYYETIDGQDVKKTAILTKNLSFIFGGIFNSNIEQATSLTSRIPPQICKVFQHATSYISLYNGTLNFNNENKPFGHNGHYYYALFFSNSGTYYVIWETGQIAQTYHIDGVKKIIESQKKPERIEFRIPLNKIRFFTRELRVLKEYIEGVNLCYNLEIGYYKFKSYNADLAAVLCTKTLDNIKKAFEGSLKISVLGSYNEKGFHINSIENIEVDDETFKKLKKVVIDKRLRDELRSALKQARIAGNFYDRNKLKEVMKSKSGKDVTEQDIEDAINKKFKLRTYDEAYFKFLNDKLNGKTYYLGEECVVFPLNVAENYEWRIVEVPGKSSATYIFDDKIENISEFLAAFEDTEGLKGAFTDKNNIPVDSEELQKDPNRKHRIEEAEKLRFQLGFITRVIHKGYSTWQVQIDNLIENCLILSGGIGGTKSIVAKQIKDQARKRK